jgi:hypothetical protein
VSRNTQHTQVHTCHLPAASSNCSAAAISCFTGSGSVSDMTRGASQRTNYHRAQTSTNQSYVTPSNSYQLCAREHPTHTYTPATCLLPLLAVVLPPSAASQAAAQPAKSHVAPPSAPAAAAGTGPCSLQRCRPGRGACHAAAAPTYHLPASSRASQVRVAAIPM